MSDKSIQLYENLKQLNKAQFDEVCLYLREEYGYNLSYVDLNKTPSESANQLIEFIKQSPQGLSHLQGVLEKCLENIRQASDNTIKKSHVELRYTANSRNYENNLTRLGQRVELKHTKNSINYENGLTILGKYVAEYVERIQDLQLREEFDLFKFNLRRILDDRKFGPNEKLDSDLNRVILQLNVITRRLNIGMTFDDLCVQTHAPNYPTDDGKKTPPEPKPQKAHLQIDKDDKKQLVELLLGYPTIENEESRKRLLKELQPSLSTPIGYNKSLMLHVHSIVNACLEDKGGIETLIDLLRYFEEDETPVQIFEETLKDILTPKPITNARLKKLRSLLKSFSLPDDDKLKAIYAKCVLPNMTKPHNYQISGLLNCLAKMGPSSTGQVPMLDFLLQLMPYANGSKAENDLQAWMREVGEHLILTETQIDQLFHNDKLQPSTTTVSLHLLIELEPEQDELDDNFIVHAWRVKLPKDIKNVFDDDEKTFVLKNMPNLIGKLLDSIKPDLNAADNQLMIEFFLPFNLLCYPIDHLPVSDPIQDDVPIGIRYPVVIRSRERLRNDTFWSSWNAHWNNDKLHQVVSDTDVVWMNEDRFRAVYPKLNGTDAICLVMTFPHKTIVDPKKAMLSHAIKLGVPIALWARKIDDTDDIQLELKNLLSEGTLEELPERVRKKREEKWAAEEEHKAGYNLSLLWDDPNRIPVTNLEHPTQS